MDTLNFPIEGQDLILIDQWRHRVQTYSEDTIEAIGGYIMRMMTRSDQMTIEEIRTGGTLVQINRIARMLASICNVIEMSHEYPTDIYNASYVMAASKMVAQMSQLADFAVPNEKQHRIANKELSTIVRYAEDVVGRIENGIIYQGAWRQLCDRISNFYIQAIYHM